ncbi:alkyl hydroperoxide reductase [bacterium]|nr:MAG: alkyl hydroperoxide reductase [bacterium]
MFPDEVVVVGIHSAKFPSEQITRNLREAVLRHGIDHPVVNDAQRGIWEAYAIRAWPTVLLVDPAGRIAGSWAGEILAEDLAVDIRRLIDRHAAEGTLDRRPVDTQPERAGVPDRPLAYPSKVLADPENGRLFISDTGHHRVLEVALDADGIGGAVRRVFGSGTAGLVDGPAGRAAFHGPHGLDRLGATLYVADTENHAVRAIDLDAGTVRTVAGMGEKAHGRLVLEAPTATPLRSPWAVLAVEHLLFIAMAGAHQIWVLVDGEALGPFAGNGREALVDGPRARASFNQPMDLALGYSHLFVADAEASAVRAIRLDDDPEVFTLVGTGLFDWGDRDGTGVAARLQHPAGLAFGNGTLYVADSYNHKVKTLDPRTGTAATLVGTGDAGHADGPFETARLFEPEGVSAAGTLLYVADTNNHAVRVADLVGRSVTTLALRGA